MPQVCVADRDIVWSAWKHAVKRDKTKGIVCKPMPPYWYEPRALKRPESGNEEEIKLYELNKRIIADRKPYFMRYIYPALMKDYKKYDKTTNAKSLIEFGIPVAQLEKIPESERTERQNEFMTYYKKMMPVGSNDSTMNRICRRVEGLTESIKFNEESDGFDYTIMKSGAKYTKTQYGYILKLFKEHKNKLQSIVKRHMARVKSKEDFADYRETMMRHFIRSAYQLCSNRSQLLDIVLDICYKREGTKQFAWDVVGDDIFESLLASRGNKMYYPVLDPDGDIDYRGDTYSMMCVEVSRLGDCPE